MSQLTGEEGFQPAPEPSAKSSAEVATERPGQALSIRVAELKAQAALESALEMARDAANPLSGRAPSPWFGSVSDRFSHSRSLSAG